MPEFDLNELYIPNTKINKPRKFEATYINKQHYTMNLLDDSNIKINKTPCIIWAQILFFFLKKNKEKEKSNKCTRI